MELKSLIQGHKARMCWGQDSNLDNQIPNPHSRLLHHDTEPRSRGRGDMGPGKLRRTPRKIHGEEGWGQNLSCAVHPPGTVDGRVIQGEAGQVGG